MFVPFLGVAFGVNILLSALNFVHAWLAEKEQRIARQFDKLIAKMELPQDDVRQITVRRDKCKAVDRSWRNPDCSLTIWTTKVFTLAVQVALKNGQIIRTRHRLTFNEDFRTRVFRPQDTVHHENAMVSFGVETPASMVEPAPHEADAFTVETQKL